MRLVLASLVALSGAVAAACAEPAAPAPPPAPAPVAAPAPPPPAPIAAPAPAPGSVVPADPAHAPLGYVTGSSTVRLGMTETEVNAVMGGPPTKRKDADVAWEGLRGDVPGTAVGRFVGDQLVRIEFIPTDIALPRVEPDAAKALTESASVKQRAVAKKLTMQEIMDVTKTPPFRASWAMGLGDGGKILTMNRWMWEIEPGGMALVVADQAGFLGQPFIRPLR